MNVDKAAETTNIAAANNSANCTVRRALTDRKRFCSVAIVHRHWRRAKGDREARIPLRCRELALDDVGLGAKVWMPDRNLSGRCRSIREADNAVRAGLRGPLAVR